MPVYGIISEYDYPAFLELAGNDFPKSYETWLYGYEKRAREDRAAKWSVEKQDIFAAEFAQYCKRVGCAPTQFNLDALADEKHKEKEKDKSTKIK